MIMVHSAPARHVAHHLTKLSAAQSTEDEQLFDSTPRQGPAQRGQHRTQRTRRVPSARSAPTMLWRPRPAAAPPGQASPITGKPGCHAPAGLAATPKRVCREPWLEPTAHRQ